MRKRSRKPWAARRRMRHPSPGKSSGDLAVEGGLRSLAAVSQPDRVVTTSCETPESVVPQSPLWREPVHHGCVEEDSNAF